EKEPDVLRGDRFEPVGDLLLVEPPGELAEHVAPGRDRARAPARRLTVGDPEIDTTGQATSLHSGGARRGAGFGRREMAFPQLSASYEGSQGQVRPKGDALFVPSFGEPHGRE